MRVGAARARRPRRRAWPRRTWSGGFCGSRRTMRSTCGLKPMSSMRSASSRTRMRTARGRRAGAAARSSSRPGVATRTCAPLMRLRLRAERDAAVGGRDRRPFGCASDLSSSVTWLASSRVGTSTRAEGRRRPVVVRSTIGSAKARVLPEPVGGRRENVEPAEGVGQDERLDAKRRRDGASGERVDDGRGHAELAEGVRAHVVRLLSGSRLAYLETPEGGTRSSSHRAA